VWDFDAYGGNEIEVVFRKRSRDETSSTTSTLGTVAFASRSRISLMRCRRECSTRPTGRPDIIWWSASKGSRRIGSRSTQILYLSEHVLAGFEADTSSADQR